MAIRKVVLPDGTEDKDAGWGRPQRKRVVADWVADEVTKILEENIDAGTGTNAGVFFSRPAAGKTGTTDEHTDAWFCGYTPNLSTTVWMGSRRGRCRWRTSTGSRSPAAPSRRSSGTSSCARRSGTRPRSSSGAESEPTWVPFERGQYANDSYYDDDDDDYYYAPPDPQNAASSTAASTASSSTASG